MDYRIAFENAEWEPTLDGTARLKRVVRGGKIFRLVELTPATVHAHWCEVGHVGLIVEGEMEIDFDGDVQQFRAGDALDIPHGKKDKHRPRALSDRALMFLIEEEDAQCLNH